MSKVTAMFIVCEGSDETVYGALSALRDVLDSASIAEAHRMENAALTEEEAVKAKEAEAKSGEPFMPFKPGQ